LRGDGEHEANAAAVTRTRPIKVFVFKWLMAALLAAGLGGRIYRGADVHFGHHSAEVLGVVREVVEIRRVQIELLTRG